MLSGGEENYLTLTFPEAWRPSGCNCSASITSVTCPWSEAEVLVHLPFILHVNYWKRSSCSHCSPPAVGRGRDFRVNWSKLGFKSIPVSEWIPFINLWASKSKSWVLSLHITAIYQYNIFIYLLWRVTYYSCDVKLKTLIDILILPLDNVVFF